MEQGLTGPLPIALKPTKHHRHRDDVTHSSYHQHRHRLLGLLVAMNRMEVDMETKVKRPAPRIADSNSSAVVSVNGWKGRVWDVIKASGGMEKSRF